MLSSRYQVTLQFWSAHQIVITPSWDFVLFYIYMNLHLYELNCLLKLSLVLTSCRSLCL